MFAFLPANIHRVNVEVWALTAKKNVWPRKNTNVICVYADRSIGHGGFLSTDSDLDEPNCVCVCWHRFSSISLLSMSRKFKSGKEFLLRPGGGSLRPHRIARSGFCLFGERAH